MVQSDITRMTSLDVRKSLGNSLINKYGVVMAGIIQNTTKGHRKISQRLV